MKNIKAKIQGILMNSSQKSVIGWAIEEDDFEHVAEEIVKNCFIPNIVSSATSKDYTRLYEKINKGEIVPCFVDYKSFNLKKVYRDVASIRKRPDNSIDIGVRGISYGGVSEWHLKDITELEAFIYECERLNLEYYT